MRAVRSTSCSSVASSHLALYIVFEADPDVATQDERVSRRRKLGWTDHGNVEDAVLGQRLHIIYRIFGVQGSVPWKLPVCDGKAGVVLLGTCPLSGQRSRLPCMNSRKILLPLQ